MSNIITTYTAARDVAALLSSLGYGAIGTDLFVWKEPDDPASVKDEVVTVYDTGQFQPSELNYSYEYPTIQVRVRGKPGKYQAGKTKVMELMNALHGYVGVVGSTYYHLIKVAHGITDLGEDDRGRPRWSFNCEIQRSS
jgi:hypothetical protein